MVNIIEIILLCLILSLFAILFLIIVVSWLYGMRHRYWVPFDKTVALLALLIGSLPNWHLFIENVGETTDAPKT